MRPKSSGVGVRRLVPPLRKGCSEKELTLITLKTALRAGAIALLLIGATTLAERVPSLDLAAAEELLLEGRDEARARIARTLAAFQNYPEKR